MARWTAAPMTALVLGSALVLAAACDNGPSAVAKGGDEDAGPAAAAAAQDFAARGADRRPEGEDHRAGPALKIDGRPMWAATRRYTAREGAQRTFERNGEAFGAKSVDEFVRLAHDFVANPPSGVERIDRPNGDTLYYDRGRNIFAVANKNGLPKTMFKPDDGPAYWDKQKTRQTAARSRRDGDEG